MLTGKMDEPEETVGFRVVHIAFCQEGFEQFFDGLLSAALVSGSRTRAT
jgi:hypothetical protein